MKTIKLNSKGDDVKLLQRLVGTTSDGSFGPATEKLVKKWQADHGLVDDGIFGPKSWDKVVQVYSVSKDVIYDPLIEHITKRNNRSIKYIVIHYTAGSKSTSGTASATKKVFERRAASADFVVDDMTIVQCNPDIANNYTWAVGDPLNKNRGGSFNKICMNNNSISIEMCSTLTQGSAKYPNHKGWAISQGVIDNTLRLVRLLMKKYNIPIDRVIRHYDVTGKLCPGVVGWNLERIKFPMGSPSSEFSTSSEWIKFKQSI